MRHLTHQTLTKVTDDIGRRRTFNTAIAAVMELMNGLARFEDDSDRGRAVRQEALEIVVLCSAPIVPHACHVLWQALGQKRRDDRRALARARSGRAHAGGARDRGAGEWQASRAHQVPATADEAAITQAALGDANVQRFVMDKPVRRVIVKGKLVNVVV